MERPGPSEEPIIGDMAKPNDILERCVLKLACWNIDGTVLRNQQDSATLDSFVSSVFKI